MPELKDIIIVSVVLVLIVFFVVMAKINSAKIKNSAKKSEAPKAETKSEVVQKTETEKPKQRTTILFNDPELSKGNYLHERFNDEQIPAENYYFRNGKIYETNERRKQELSEIETAETLKKLKEKRTRDFYDYSPSLDTASGAIIDIESRDYEYDDDYEDNITYETDNSVAEEFENLSPTMKSLIASKVLDKKDENNS